MVSQSRYAPLGSQIDPERLWVVPFCWARGDLEARTRDCRLLTEDLTMASIELPEGAMIDAGWLLPNADGTGYYRFSLPYDLWQALGRGFSKLTNAEQLVTMDSVGAEFAAGRIDIQTVWRFIDEAVRDDERRVVQAAIREAGRFGRLTARDDAALEGYRAAVLDVFSARYQALVEAASDDPEQVILKSSLERFLVRTGEEETLRQDLAEAAAAFVGLPDVTSDRVLNTDEYLSALAIGMQVYREPFLDRLLEARVAFDDPVFEQAVAYAIGENRDPALNDRILALALSGELGSRETLTIVQGQMRQDETRAQTWTWLQANFPAFLDVIPRQRKRASPALANALCSEAEKAELIQLFESHGELAEGHERSLSQTTERIELCAAIEDAKGAEVRAFFAGKR